MNRVQQCQTATVVGGGRISPPTRIHHTRKIQMNVARVVQQRVYASGSGQSMEIPTRLNTIPHERSTRYWFYNDCVSSVEAALNDTENNTLVSLSCTIPELNQNFDVYRVGTLLELVRELTTSLGQTKGRKCKVCVQQSLGQGVFCGTPLALSGVRRILQQMDWGEYDVSIGQLGRDQIDECDDYILISPQNITGHSVVPLIADMVEEISLQGGNKRIILINPKLDDILSSGGVMSVRGRQDRMDFVSRFIPAYHFRLLYIGMGPYPIMGALRYSYGGPWEVYKRVDFKNPGDGTPRERYDLIETFENAPDSSKITAAFKAVQQKS